jgi:hypothetical protein
MKRTLILMLAAALTLPLAAPAGEIYDVELPDSITVGDHTLILNGMGLRKKAFIKVYVGGLYLAEKSADASAILAADSPRRVVMAFRFGVGADKMCGAWEEGLENNTPDASTDVAAKFDTLCTYMDDLDKGDQMIATYIPDQGTEIEVKGTSMGTIEGKPFADALFACWLGPKPPSDDLKEGMLGL